jgi:hypothetical protein
MGENAESADACGVAKQAEEPIDARWVSLPIVLDRSNKRDGRLGLIALDLGARDKIGDLVRVDRGKPQGKLGNGHAKHGAPFAVRGNRYHIVTVEFILLRHELDGLRLPRHAEVLNDAAHGDHGLAPALKRQDFIAVEVECLNGIAHGRSPALTLTGNRRHLPVRRNCAGR